MSLSRDWRVFYSIVAPKLEEQGYHVGEAFRRAYRCNVGEALGGPRGEHAWCSFRLSAYAGTALRITIVRDGLAPYSERICEISFDAGELASIAAAFPDWLAALDRTGEARPLPLPELRWPIWGAGYRWTLEGWQSACAALTADAVRRFGDARR